MNASTRVRCLDLVTGEYVTEHPSVTLCLGNFDGVHLAHKKLIDATVDQAARLDCQPAAFCFYSPSWEEKKDGQPGRELTTLDEKIEYFKKFGLKYLFLSHFSDCKDVSADEFATLWLKKNCLCEGVACGFNYTFGAGGLGRTDDLRRHFGDRLTVLEPTRSADGEVISSSRIRQALDDGKIEEANALLGHPYSYTGPVLHGQGLGRTLGFPTANIRIPDEKLIPPLGVYAADCIVDGKRFPAVTNVGRRPTVADHSKVGCETYLYHFDGDLYGKTVRVDLVRFIRPEKKFGSTEELRVAVERDKSEALKGRI